MSPSSTMNIYDENWTLQSDICPCDVDFVEWLGDRDIRDSTIFHFGSGGHHLVGTQSAEDGRGNAVFAVTASPQEHGAFIDLVIGRPDILRSYVTVFTDAYALDRRLLPAFDVATLFHICEFRDERNDAYQAMTDVELCELVIERTRPGGYILFYAGSFGFHRQPHGSAEVIATLERRGKIISPTRYKTLIVYRRA